ncbi:hypothetical protein Tco_1355561, partial [Tanacetum coccineum]
LEDFDAWLNEQGIDDDEVPTEEVSSELLAEVSEKEMTSDDIQRMQNAINNMMRDRCNSEDNLEELNTRWVKKTIKRFNLYARYVIDHWKSPWAQHDHIKRQMNKRDNPKTSTLMVNDEYLEFAESDYKYLHKNDIEDIGYVYWERIHDYQLGMEIGLIYENNKKEKRVMVIKEIPNFCDATLKILLEKVNKFNLDVKHGYADPNLSDEDAEYIKFYEEYIKESL